MVDMEKVRGKAQQFKGRVQQVVGKATGSEETQAHGKVNEAEGKARGKVADVKANAQSRIAEIKRQAKADTEETKA